MSVPRQAYEHALPDRKLFSLPRDRNNALHTRATLKDIADEFKIKRKRRLFYERALFLAIEYWVDRSIEEDLLHVSKAKQEYSRAVRDSLRLLSHINSIFQNKSCYSLWHEANFMCTGDLRDAARTFSSDELTEQLVCFSALTQNALSSLPSPSPSRKKMLALRKWVDGHLYFWTKELGRPIALINDKRDGCSWCHRFLCSLLAELDPTSVRGIRTILKDQRRSAGGIEAHRS